MEMPVNESRDVPKHTLSEWIHKKHLDHPPALKADPFPHIVVEDFFLEEKFRIVENALKSGSFTERESDLFTFNQVMLEDSNLQSFVKFFGSRKFIDYVEHITGVNALKDIDASGFCYGDTDHLLPHDDRMPGRKVAYIVNFSDLEGKDGGQLDLFAGRKIAKSYTPKRNSVVLFPVSEKSVHQVREVTNAKRYTIAGWFYG